MRKTTGCAFCALLLAFIGTMAFAQVSSTASNESGAASIQATKASNEKDPNEKDPKDMSPAELTATVKRLDADLFAAYNNCDLEKFGSFFPEHLEFYHDQTGGGPMTREQLVAAIKQNICGKVHRELVSVEVYPMKNYGALETGVHRFSHPGIDDIFLPHILEHGRDRIMLATNYRFKVNVIGFDRSIPAVAEYAPTAHTVPLAVVALNSSAAWPGSGADTELHFVPSQCSVIG